MKSSITKSVCERYDIYDGRGNHAVIMIAEAGGILSIVSSYGEYGYTWVNYGPGPFKRFLAKLNDDYLIGKLAPKRDFDSEASRDRVLKSIIERRKERSIDKDLARECWEYAERLHAHCADELLRSIEDSPDLCKVFDEPWYEDWIVEVPNRQCAGFLERMWPIFIEAIKKELEPVEAALAGGGTK